MAEKITKKIVLIKNKNYLLKNLSFFYQESKKIAPKFWGGASPGAVLNTIMLLNIV